MSIVVGRWDTEPHIAILTYLGMDNIFQIMIEKALNEYAKAAHNLLAATMNTFSIESLCRIVAIAAM